jgi:hypothetical protein
VEFFEKVTKILGGNVDHIKNRLRLGQSYLVSGEKGPEGIPEFAFPLGFAVGDDQQLINGTGRPGQACFAEIAGIKVQTEA